MRMLVDPAVARVTKRTMDRLGRGELQVRKGEAETKEQKVRPQKPNTCWVASSPHTPSTIHSRAQITDPSLKRPSKRQERKAVTAAVEARR